MPVYPRRKTAADALRLPAFDLVLSCIQSPDAMDQPGRIIFVVDDRTTIAESLSMVLKQAGYRAIAFDDPAMALSAAAIKKPDVLISDVIMPRMTGVELALRVRNAHPECRVLLYSGQIDTSDLEEQAKKEGHHFEILTKPVQPEQILERLRDPVSANPQ